MASRFNQGLRSSKTGVWETPQDLFDSLDREFNFTLDPCATPDNAKCLKYITPDEDGLSQSWEGHRVFMNPPYGREIGQWIEKAYNESRRAEVVVCLLPARTDTRWFHDFCLLGEIRFLRGRLKFGGSKQSAPFPSMVVIYRDCWCHKEDNDGQSVDEEAPGGTED